MAARKSAKKRTTRKKPEERKESKATERRERKTGREAPKRKTTKRASTRKKVAKAVPKRRIAQEKKSSAKIRKAGGFAPVKRPGAATAKAKAAGMSVDQWARKHKNDPGRTGKQARFVLISKKWRKGGKKKA